MSKSVFTAVDPQGGIHKRTSQSRIYTHTVVVLRGEVSSARYLSTTIAAAKEQAPKSYATSAAFAKGVFGKGWEVYRPGHYLEHQAAETISRAQRFIAEFPTVEAYVDHEVARATATHAKLVANGYYNTYANVGWCGRRDLAEKLAAIERIRGFENVAVLEAIKA